MTTESVEMKRLKHQRAVLKGNLTRLQNSFSAIQNGVDRNGLCKLKKQLNRVETNLGEFENIQTELELLNIDESHERTVFMTLFDDLTAAVTTFLEEHENSTITTADTFVNRPTRLPNIELPQFSGDYTEWRQFFETYNSLVHTDNTLNPIHKFHYLKSSLTKSAASVIDSIEITAENYQIAYDLLKARFENKRLLIHNHVKDIFELENLEKENHLKLRSLTDKLQKHLRSLHALNQPTQHWDTLIVYLISNKLDLHTRKEWESCTTNSDFPSLEEFLNFLNNRCSLLERTAASSKHHKNQSVFKSINFSSINDKIVCAQCKGHHYIYRCEALLKLPIKERIDVIRKLKLCLNCLRTGHNFHECKSSKCKKCNKAHNTILHLEVEPTANQQVFSINNQIKQTLLSTAVVETYRKNNKNQTVYLRALLDSGSQSNFITSEKCNELKLITRKISLNITGISQNQTKITEMADILLKSRVSSFQVKLSCLVIPKITEYLPEQSFKTNLNIPDHIRTKLADPEYNKSRPIDLLIGSEIFWNLLNVGQFSLGKQMPVLQKTLLGWVVAGEIPIKTSHKSQLSSNLSLENQIKKFWEIEDLDLNSSSIVKVKNNQAEEIFINNHIRIANGHFQVDLPFIDSTKQLGESRSQALEKFLAIERRLDKQPSLKSDYQSFLNEYLKLGHMEEVPSNEIFNVNNYYLPHHPVIKNNSTTTRLRVVFNASAKTENNISLNDNLHVGPKLQNDIFTILLNFRCYKYVIVADCEKMYRQIYINPKHRDFQRILWRQESRQPIKDYRLTTVTYGTSSAPYLAIRCLHQLAEEGQHQYPLAADAIRNDFYIDDLITGHNSITGTIELREQIICCLRKGGFKLRKWAANHPDLLPSEVENTVQDFTFSQTGDINTLGLIWNNQADILKYAVQSNYTYESKITKRIILSHIASLYDPLGLLAPILTVAKRIMQKLWSLQISWDESVPIAVHTEWNSFYQQLNNLRKLNIPRNIMYHDGFDLAEIHGFADASKNAYGCCIYLRVKSHFGWETNIICAKSRVAPLKPITIPRLELCAAVLLAKLFKKVEQNLKINVKKSFLWTDSTIVLSWLASPSSNFNSFVSNRINEIKRLTRNVQWGHVRTNQNPADYVSRGMTVNRLIDSELWWKGPSFLADDEIHCPQLSQVRIEKLPEIKQSISLVVKLNVHIDFIIRFSNYNKLIRSLAYCMRFINNSTPKTTKVSGFLNSTELKCAETKLLSLIEAMEFEEEIKLLKTKKELKHGKIINLKPFIDSDGLLRVGGRLTQANLPYDSKHPIILPKHYVTNLIIIYIHQKYLHAGTQATLSAIRQKYWPISGRDVVRKLVYNCVTCFRVQPKPLQQLMGNLPAERVQPCKPFLNTGIDYCGPFDVRKNRGRGSNSIKCWVAVFVCFVTKATHLELVADCTSEAFMAALKRFIGRRGRVAKIFTDNATTFIGARNELKRLFDQNSIVDYLACQRINWSTIPARSPHRGGLWEGAVKSVKYHLKRVVGRQLLHYDEFSTLLIQIEACLNSRPITPISNDINDCTALTPGHFLVGEPLVTIVEGSMEELNPNYLSRWKRVQQMIQHYWKRFQKEYLHNLQQRTKWTRRHQYESLEGALVLLVEDQPPLHWKMGRIIEVHSGPDGNIRTATVKTTSGTTTRAVSKLCVLPIEHAAVPEQL